MNTGNRTKKLIALAAALSLSFTVDAWAGKIADFGSKFGGNIGRSMSGPSVRLDGAQTRVAVESYYGRLGRSLEGGMATLTRAVQDDIDELGRLISDPSIPKDQLPKLRALHAELTTAKANVGITIHINKAYSVGETSTDAQTRTQRLDAVAASGRPSVLESAFGDSVTDNRGNAVFVTANRTAAGTVSTHVMTASADGGRVILGNVFPAAITSDAPGRLEILHRHVIANIAEQAPTKQVAAALTLTARNIDPNHGSYNLGRMMGLSRQDIANLTRSGVALLSLDGRVPELTGRMDSDVLAQFRARYEAFIQRLVSNKSSFATEDEARAYVTGPFTRLLVASTDFAGTKGPLPERIADALSEVRGTKIEASSDEVHVVLGKIAEMHGDALKNDHRFAVQIESAFRNGDVAKLADLIKSKEGAEDARSVVDEISSRSRSCAVG
jgi:hypothetical protein